MGQLPDPQQGDASVLANHLICSRRKKSYLAVVTLFL